LKSNTYNLLSTNHSKAIITHISNTIGNNQSLFDELIDCFFSNEYRIVQRAVWVVTSVAIKYPMLIEKHYVKLIELMDDTSMHNAITRNITKIFKELPIPEKYEGAIIDKCFKIIESDYFDIAPQAFSIHILIKYKKKHPELFKELKELLQIRLPYFQHSPGLLNIAAKVLKD
jgi:hypothetical protein